MEDKQKVGDEWLEFSGTGGLHFIRKKDITQFVVGKADADKEKKLVSICTVDGQMVAEGKFLKADIDQMMKQLKIHV